MSDTTALADVTREIQRTHPSAVYIGVAKGNHRAARFGLVLEFRVPYGEAVYGWRDDVSGDVVVSQDLPPS